MVCYLRPTKGRKNTITHFSGNKSRLITRHVDPLHAAIRLLTPKQPNCSTWSKKMIQPMFHSNCALVEKLHFIRGEVYMRQKRKSLSGDKGKDDETSHPIVCKGQ